MPTRSSLKTGRLLPTDGAENLVNFALLEEEVKSSDTPFVPMKSALKVADEALADRFWKGEPVEVLVQNRAWFVEQILILAWQKCFSHLEFLPENLALAAVGGFGRGELHPHSDVDLMILLEDEHPDRNTISAIEVFVTLLWDTGFYLGHSVRTLKQCKKEAKADVVVATTLMESRLLAGNSELFESMVLANATNSIWPGPRFFDAKYREQIERHEKFHDTAYNLEPNIKEGPGGLRDIQMISWVAKRHLQADSLHALVEHGFLTEIEFDNLQAGQRFLWKVRFALHLIAGRAEDRLLFDYQREIALRLGYGEDQQSNLPVEKFMQAYFQIVMQLERLNESLLQLFREELLSTDLLPAKVRDDGFLIQKGFLGVIDESLFEQQPQAIIRMFVLLASDPEILGVRASTIRLIRHRVRTLGQDFANNSDVLNGFYQLLCQPQGVYTQLQRMNRYGVLAAMLPSFANITGRMQFDLFHVYTVDQHILFVIRNLRRFAYGKYAEMFPGISEIFERIKKPELLYLAALFHDIAKGRSGDHSELGAVDALEFCQRLPLSWEEAEIVSWLVKQHLLMSQTAQRKDISDPEVIAEFSDLMTNQARLDMLYLLTVADIAATSPKLWNGWKSGLLRGLFLASSKVLTRGSQLEVEEHVEGFREKVFKSLLKAGIGESEILDAWQWLPPNVFQRFTKGQMIWATKRLIENKNKDGVVTSIRSRRGLSISELLISAPDYTGLFAAATIVFDEMGLNILSARVLTTKNQRSFDLFQLMNAQGKPLELRDRKQLDQRLKTVLGNKRIPRPARRKLPRRLRPFITSPKIIFDLARSGTVTSLDLECSDRPGLLSQLASAMVACDVQIHDAKIATFGERVEDTFLVTDHLNQPLSEQIKAKLIAEIKLRLEILED